MNRVRSALTASALVALFVPASPARAAIVRPAILVLFVDDSSQSWIREMSDGIADVALRQGPRSPILYYEYLDAVRFEDAGHRARLRALLNQKYEDRQIDLVVAVAPSAIAFVDEARDALWPDRPALLASYSALVSDSAARHAKTGALTFEWGFDRAVSVMKAVFPDTTTVAVAGGDSDLERTRQSRNVAELRRSGLTVLDLTRETATATLDAVSRLPAHTTLFIAGGQVDADGSVMPTWPLCESLASAANRPTFMLGAQFLGCGVVGGLMRDFRKIGTRIGERAMTALGGTLTANEHVAFDDISVLAYDARQLERWKVDEARLPRGGDVRFRRFSLWREYRSGILVIGAGLVVQSLLIVGLLSQRRMRLIAERETRRSLAVAAHADRRAAMSALTGSIAHELSQPLGSIQNNATAAQRLIATHRATPEELTEILGDIQREDARAAQIIQRHRTMLKAHELDARPLDLCGVVRESLALVAHDARMRNVQIDDQMTAGPCVVMGDQVLLQQVMVNLVMNAMDAMASTPVARKRVLVGNAISRTGVEVTVRDWGPGLPAELDGRLFEPFVTTKVDGLGIGLSIVRSIVVAHGGTIAAHNAPGGGALFQVTLPCQPS